MPVLKREGAGLTFTLDARKAEEFFGGLRGKGIPAIMSEGTRELALFGHERMVRRAPVARRKWGKNYVRGGLRKSIVVGKTGSGNDWLIGPTVRYAKYVVWGVAGTGRSKAGPRPFHDDAARDLDKEAPRIVRAVMKRHIRGNA